MSQMIFDVGDKPQRKQLVVSVIQQILANIAATITVPLLIGLNDFIASAILGCGVGTLIYIIVTKRKSPVLLSSNFSFITALILAYRGSGFLGIVLGGLIAGICYLILSLIVKKVGTAWIARVFPPVIIGPVVALIGLSLSVNAVQDLIKVENYQYIDAFGQTVFPYNLVGLFCGIVTFLIIVVCAVQRRSKMVSMIPFLFGILGGYLLALFFSIIGYSTGNTYLQIINFAPITENFQDISVSSFISVPRIAFAEGIKEINAGTVKLTWFGVLEIVLSFVPISLVGFSEHIADHKNLGDIIGHDLLNDEPGLSRTLLGDGLGSIAGTWFGICPNTTYGEAVSCVAITKNASVSTMIWTAISCLALSFFTPLIAALRTIPSCIVGGMCLSLFGFIAVSGLKMLRNVNFDSNKNIFTLSVVLVAGVGSLSLCIPYKLGLLDGTDFYGVVKYIEITSIAFALLLGLLTYNLARFIETRTYPKVP